MNGAETLVNGPNKVFYKCSGKEHWTKCPAYSTKPLRTGVTKELWRKNEDGILTKHVLNYGINSIPKYHGMSLTTWNEINNNLWINPKSIPPQKFCEKCECHYVCAYCLQIIAYYTTKSTTEQNTNNDDDENKNKKKRSSEKAKVMQGSTIGSHMASRGCANNYVNGKNSIDCLQNALLSIPIPILYLFYIITKSVLVFCFLFLFLF